MDTLIDYNNYMEQISILLNVLDISTKEGLTKPKDKISYVEYRGNKFISFCRTREKIESLLKQRIKIIIRVNVNVKKEFLYQDSYLSKHEREKMLLMKKNN